MFNKFKDPKKMAAGGLSDVEKKAKMSVVHHMRDMAASQMGDKLNNLKKVSVASDSPEGLSDGLDKAKQLLSGGAMHDMVDESEQPDHLEDGDLDGGHDPENSEEEDEGGDDESPEADEHDGMSEEELDAKLHKLMAAKNKLKK